MRGDNKPLWTASGRLLFFVAVIAEREQIKKLTDSMDGGLMAVIEKKGGHTGH